MFTRGVSKTVLELFISMVLFCFAVSVLVFLWLLLIFVAFVGVLYTLLYGVVSVFGVFACLARC